MKRLSWSLAGIAIVAIVAAACSGNGGGLIGVGSHTYPSGFIRATLKTPPEKQKKLIDKMVARALRARHVNPKFLPFSTTEVDFNLISVGGNTVTGQSPYSFTLYPGSACSSSPSPLPSGATPSPAPNGYVCTILKTAPASTDQYDVVACYLPAQDGCTTDSNAVILSESTTIIDVPPGGTASAQFSLNPVVGGLSWVSGTPWGNGGQVPQWDSTYYQYSCAATAHPRPGPRPHGAIGGSCYDPILNGTQSATFPSLPATPVYDTVSLNVLDGEGDVIIPASGGGAPYGYPVFLSPSGTADSITESCADAHVQLIQSGSLMGSLPDASPVPAADLANGFTGATHTSITSPVVGSDGSTGYDYTNTPVTVYGNNIAYVNFDGGYAGYSPDESETCQASDSLGIVSGGATYYIGVGQGTISWTGNARHHLIRARH